MSYWSIVCVIRIEKDSMEEAITEVNEYLDENDYLCSSLYIVEEKDK